VTVDAALTGRELLRDAAAEVASWPAVSASRARQVRWVAGEYGRALEHPDHPLTDAEATVRRLFRAGPVNAYLALARRGELRMRKAADPKRGSDNSEQTRIEVLGMLVTACEAQAYAQLPAQPDPPSRTPVAKRPRSLLRDSLRELADRPGATPGQVRMLAIGATVIDTAARAGELCSRTLEDLSPTLEELRVLRRPQGWSEDAAYVELLALSGLTRAAHRGWLAERQALLTRIGGTATALWVSLHPNHHDGVAVPAGTPLRPRGLARAWTRAVTETNIELAAEPSWTPLPTRMEQLRRGVGPTAVQAPREVDAERAAELLETVARRAAELAAARSGGEEGTTAEPAARVAVRQAVREAWAQGIEHQVQLGVLADAGLTDTAALTAAGWESALLAAIERAAGWGRARRKAPGEP
jgi:integrase